MPEQLGDIRITDLSLLPEAARQIIDLLSEEAKVWLFYGEMGAGKTTIIKALCEAWGVADTVSSPTFSLVREYRSRELQTFYHFDFYRIEDEEEAWDIGIEDYFYSGNYCLVEWPERVKSLLPDAFVRIDVKVGQDNSRRVYLSSYE